MFPHAISSNLKGVLKSYIHSHYLQEKENYGKIWPMCTCPPNEMIGGGLVSCVGHRC